MICVARSIHFTVLYPPCINAFVQLLSYTPHTQVKRKRVPTGRKRGGQKAAKPTESSRPSGSQATSQPGSELTAAPGADEDEAEGGGGGLVDDADTEEEQIGACCYVG